MAWPSQRWQYTTLLLALLCACDAASEPPVITKPADPPGPSPVRREFIATTFLVDKLYSHGIAVRRATGAGGDCAGDEVIVANGHDHIPQFTARVAVLPGSCTPVVSPERWSATAAHFSDVAAADLEGDGADEIVMVSLADATRRVDSGTVVRIDARGVEHPLPSGYAASSVAIDDLDGDGDLDIVVGSFWAPLAMMPPERKLATREIEVARTRIEEACIIQKSSRTPVWPPIFGFPVGSSDNHPAPPKPVPLLGSGELGGAVFVYLQTGPGEFEEPRWLDSPAAVDLHVEDIDGDGHLDLLTAGRDVRIIYGPLTAGDRAIEVHKLPWSGVNQRPLLAHSVDAAFTEVDGEGPRVLIAANEGCFNPLECQNLCGPGVEVWSAARTGTRTTAWNQSFRRTAGLASAVRFSSLDDGDRSPDLIVGRMTDSRAGHCQCDVRPQLGSSCIGAPLLAFRGTNSAEDGWLSRSADVIDIVDIHQPKKDRGLLPMSFRILPYASRQTRRHIEPDDRSHLVAGTAVTYTGAGHVVHVAGVTTAAGTPLAFRHGHGERHLSLTAPYRGTVNVSWRIVRGPGFLVTSASPLRVPTGASFLAEPVDMQKKGD